MDRVFNPSSGDACEDNACLSACLRVFLSDGVVGVYVYTSLLHRYQSPPPSNGYNHRHGLWYSSQVTPVPPLSRGHTKGRVRSGQGGRWYGLGL